MQDVAGLHSAVGMTDASIYPINGLDQSADMSSHLMQDHGGDGGVGGSGGSDGSGVDGGGDDEIGIDMHIESGLHDLFSDDEEMVPSYLSSPTSASAAASSASSSSAARVSTPQEWFNWT